MGVAEVERKGMAEVKLRGMAEAELKGMVEVELRSMAEVELAERQLSYGDSRLDEEYILCQFIYHHMSKVVQSC